VCQVLYNAFKRIVAHLPAEDKAKLFFGNAARVYRLGDLPRAKA
jgi:predicted TIM-barrel fold metal-dependent hydrolase